MPRLGKPNADFSKHVVLVVDDVPDNLAVAQTVLRHFGAQVYTASNGLEGLEMLQSITPTLILLDIRMPEMDGWAMFRSIRENTAHAHVPIIAITAYAMEGDREAILDGGFNGYISKPFDLYSFVGYIDQIVTSLTEKQPGSKDANL